MIARAHRFSARVERDITLPYLEFRPESAPPASGWPLVLYLHGAGEKGADGAALARSALPRLLAGALGIDAVVVCPQCPPGPSWPVADLAPLLDTLAHRGGVDATRIHLTGISMGARGAWDLAYIHADRLASIVAVCGLGIPNLAPWVAGVPAWLFHGEEDDVLPPARSAEMADALRSAGGTVRLTLLPGIGHECGERVYGDPALWRWVLAQRRGERRAA